MQIGLHSAVQLQPPLKIDRLKGQQLLLHQPGQVRVLEGGPDGTVVHPRQLQQTLHQRAHPGCHGQHAPGVLGVRLGLHQLRVGQDDGQGGLQLVAGVGHELPLLRPGPLHGPHRPPGQQDADTPEKGGGQHADARTGEGQVTEGGLLPGDVHEDQGQLPRPLEPVEAQVVFLQDPQLRLRRGGLGHDIRQHLAVAEVKAAGVLDGLAPGGDPDQKAGLAELSGYAGLDGLLGGLTQSADAVGLEGLPGEMDHEAKDHAQQRGENGHGHGDEFPAQGSDHGFSTSR